MFPSIGPNPKYHPQYWALPENQINDLVQIIESWITLARGTPADIAMMHRDRAIALLLIFTGITINEARTLNTDDFVLDDHDVRYLKVGTLHRTVPINREVRQAISRWLIMRKLVFGNGRSNALFINRRCERINCASVKQVLSRLRLESDIPFTTFSLRHTFIKRLIKDGHNEQEISMMLSRPSRAIIEMYEHSGDEPNSHGASAG